jgi:RNA polymerase sigma-70 factor (ECF subfamily)
MIAAAKLDIESYRPKLRHKVRTHIGPHSNDIEDLVQETIFRFLIATRDGKLRNPAFAGAFLYGICKNVISEYHRRVRREEPFPDDFPEAVDPGSNDSDQREVRESIARLLRELPARDRGILRICYLEEKKRKEVLAVTGMTAGQLRVVLFRARKRFRERLAGRRAGSRQRHEQQLGLQQPAGLVARKAGRA